MSILSVIGSVAGLAQGLQQNQAARGQQRQALDLYRQNAQAMQREQERRAEVARGMLASGYGDPTAQIAASRAAQAARQKTTAANLGGMYRTMGYEAGDSPFENGAQRLSEQGLAGQTLAEQQIQQNSYNQLLSLQNLYNPAQYAGANYALANGLQQDAYNQQVDVGGMVAGLANADFGFLKPRKGNGNSSSMSLTQGEFESMRTPPAGGDYTWPMPTGRFS